MKLVRHGQPGAEKPGLIDRDGVLRDLSDIVADIAQQVLSREQLRQLGAIDTATLPVVPGKPRLGAPVGAVGKMICVGMNYADHCAETGAPLPEQPVLFMKSTTAIGGAFDDVVIPRGSIKTDWEVELGVVIGEVSRDVPVEQALAHVAGYTLANEGTIRDWLRHGKFNVTQGKNFDNTGSLGPWMVTSDEIDPAKPLHLIGYEDEGD